MRIAPCAPWARLNRDSLMVKRRSAGQWVPLQRAFPLNPVSSRARDGAGGTAILPCRTQGAGRQSDHYQKNGRKLMQSETDIDQLLRQKTDAAEIPGVVAIAATGGEVIYQGAFGKRDL